MKLKYKLKNKVKIFTPVIISEKLNVKLPRSILGRNSKKFVLDVLSTTSETSLTEESEGSLG